MQAEEVMQIWAKRKLTKSGIEYAEDDEITAEDETVSMGMCDTCYSESTYLIIRINGVWALNTYSDTLDILSDLLEIASEEGSDEHR